MDSSTPVGLPEPVHVVAGAADLRRRHCAILTEAGLSVVEHSDVRGLLEHLAAAPEGTCIIEDLGPEMARPSTLVARLRDDGHALPVIVVADHMTVASAIRTIREGAIDFLVQPIDAAILLEAVQRAATLNRLLGLATGVPTGLAGMIEALTPRERDVMALLVRGMATKTIGLELGISPRTVEIHRRRILLKMQTDNVVQLTRLLLLAGHGMAIPLLQQASGASVPANQPARKP